MTKKDYELIAKAISDSKSTFNKDAELAHAAITDVALTIAERLERDNTRFDKIRFMAACNCLPTSQQVILHELTKFNDLHTTHNGHVVAKDPYMPSMTEDPRP